METIGRAICLSAVFAALSLLNIDCYAQAQKSETVKSLDAIEKELDAFKPDPELKEDVIAFTVTKQALISVREGNFGIGACLVDEKDGKTVIVGHNEMFVPYFRSDKHAEMVVLDKYEDQIRGDRPMTEGLALYSSLEPCPMCMIRSISADIRKVRYVSSDSEGAFTRHADLLPSYWKGEASARDYGELRCSPRLKEISYKLHKIALELYGDKQKYRDKQGMASAIHKNK